MSKLKTKPYKHQEEGIQFLLDNPRAMLLDEMGCLDEKTLVKVNRGGNCRTYTLKELYYKFHNTWNKQIKSYIQSEQKGFLHLNEVINIVDKKVKYCIGITTEDNKFISCTKDHKFLTSRGYKEINTLKKGDVILVNGLHYCPICKQHTEHCKKGKYAGKCRVCIYRFYRTNKKIKNGEFIDKDGYIRVTKDIRYHPTVKNLKVKAIYKHRLIYEAFLNKVSYGKWLKIIKYNSFTKKHVFLKKKDIMHHKNGNGQDNRLKNLEKITTSQHHKIHKKEINFGTFIPKHTKIKKISNIGFRHVYDISMKAPYHNFVANGFIVHNCGKTYQALASAIIRKDKGEVKRCLVICPATLKRTWMREIEKHTNEKAILIDGSKKERRQLYNDFAKDDAPLFLIVNFESFRIDFVNILFDMIIIDESVRIKNPKAITTKTIKRVPAKFRIALSGYPIANRVEDIWSQVDWVRPNYLGNRWAFEDRYTIKQATQLRDGREFKQVIAYKNLPDLAQRLRPLYLRRLKKDVLDLPPKIYETREVILSSDERKVYTQMKEEMRVWLETMGEDDLQINAKTILVQFLRLSQLTGGFVTDAQLKKPAWMKQPSKLSALDELLEEIIASGGKVVVWSRFVPVVKKLYELYKDKYGACYLTGSVPMDERQVMIDKFQTDPNCKAFIGQVQSGGMGITLTAASSEIFYDKAFISPSTVVQAEDRLHRIGQEKPVVIITLVAEGTVDQHWERLIKRKKKVAQQLLGDIPGFNVTGDDLKGLLV